MRFRVWQRVPMICAGTYLALGAVFAISIGLTHTAEQALRWMRHDPGQALFVPVGVSIAAYLLARNILDLRGLWTARNRRRLTFSLLCLAIALAVLPAAVRDDVTRVTAAPCYVYKERAACARSQEVIDASADKRKELRAAYDRDYPSGLHAFNDPERLAVTAYLAPVMSYMSFALVLVFIWHNISLAWAMPLPDHLLSRVASILLILTLWFPLRVYSETYINFYDDELDFVKHYPAIIFAGVICLLSWVLLFALYARTRGITEWAKVVLGIATVLSILVGAQYPKERAAIVEKLASYPGGMFWLAAFLFAGMIYAIVAALTPGRSVDDDGTG